MGCSPKEGFSHQASKFVDLDQKGLFKNFGTKTRSKMGVNTVVGDSMLKTAL